MSDFVTAEEVMDCPLCMEPFEVDDLKFYPCTCGYQICRFCWNRIREQEENGKCPACRKKYSENPANFTPLTIEQVVKLKAEKRQKEQQRKAKITESRKHLASVRVVQKNLVFVVGLPPRLADPEILKRHEYFGKFGKIHKVVINQSTTYAGSQGPSASAYVTYLKSDDALRAIQAVNNIIIDGRTIKSSLGTTKYCSHFMKNMACPKSDCMYLHENGDLEASFTKEQMHAGEHQEYEKKLHEELLIRTKAQNAALAAMENKNGQNNKDGIKEGSNSTNQKDNNNSNKDSWPQLDKEKKEKDKSKKSKSKNTGNAETKAVKETKKENNGALKNDTNNENSDETGLTPSSITTATDNQLFNNKIEIKESDTESTASSTSSSLSSSASASSSSSSVSSSCAVSLISAASSSSSSNNSSPVPQITTQTPPLPSSFSSSLSSSSASSTTALETTTSSTFQTNSTSSDNLLPASNNTNNNNNDISFVAKLTGTFGNNQHLEDNSYFSSNGFHKFHNPAENNTMEKNEIGNLIDELADSKDLLIDENTGHQVLTDTLPLINTSEDWEAAFGFSTANDTAAAAAAAVVGSVVPTNSIPNQMKDSNDLLQQKLTRTDISNNTLSNLSTIMGTSMGGPNCALNKEIENINKYYEYTKFQENSGLLLGSSNTKKNGYTNNIRTQRDVMNSLTQSSSLSSTHSNTPIQLDQNMSKFFSDCHTMSKEPSHPYTNGNNISGSLQEILQQKQLEEQLINIALKQNHFFSTQTVGYQNNQPTPTYSNGDSRILNNALTPLASLYAKPQQLNTHQNIRSTEAELDFDPFQETQKGLAELMENEQNFKTNTTLTTGRNGQPLNGLIHNNSQTGNHILPPPPGFIQTLNLGSKILPYINVANNTQPINNSTNSWPHTQQMQQKRLQTFPDITNTDWKILDPAILSSSRNFQFAQLPHINNRDTYNTLQQQLANQQQQQITQNSQLRQYEYPTSNNSPFSTFTQQHHQQPQPQQQSYNNFTPLNTPPHFNWLANDLTGQISSPPGFRNSQTASKQQEC